MSKFDALFKKIEVFEKLAVYGDRSSFLKSIAQDSTPKYPTSTDEANPGVQPYLPTQTVPEMTIVGNPPIPKDVQEMLSRVVTMDRLGIPLHKIDGLIGPETRTALNNFKAKYAPGEKSDAKLFDAIRKQYATNPGLYGKVDHASPAAPKAPAQPQTPNTLPTPEEYNRAQKERMNRESTPPGLTPASVKG